ncbi:MAG: NADPH-dependent FMN reductase [Silanimonas sp.]
MPETARLLAFAGSLRRESFNRKLLLTLARGAEDAGAEVDRIDLREFSLPVYDAEIEAEGMPAAVRALQARMAACAGLLIATPEYNGSMPALVKNTLDWMSRAQADGRPGTALFNGKVAGICSASPGALGGLRSLLVTRDALSKLGLWVAPSQVAVGRADAAFDAPGELVDERQRKAVLAVGAEVARAAARFAG